MTSDKGRTSSKKQENNEEKKTLKKSKTKKAGSWKLTWKKKEISKLQRNRKFQIEDFFIKHVIDKRKFIV